jgi:radical SAM-linked protein
MKMQAVYQQTGTLRFIGHLDLMRAMQRALRRSGLPVRYSQGFNPRILLSFAAPLAVGMEGRREVMEVPLEAPVAGGVFMEKLNAQLPEGIRCLACRQVDDSHPAPMAALFAAEYDIYPLQHEEALHSALLGFLNEPNIMVTYKTKRREREINLQPLIFNLHVKDGALRAVLSLNQHGSCKPELLMTALADYAGVPAPRCRVIRNRLLNNLFVPLENA